MVALHSLNSIDPGHIMPIPEFYSGRSVMVTGATGFMGKVLLEKLLRSCPDVKNVYVIVRSKKGKGPLERFKTIFDLPLFDRLKEEQPTALDKIVAMHGDMMELGLGLSPQDKQILVENVDIIFHMAATIRFDDPIKSAVIMNVRGTRELLELALNMTNLMMFLHVSTTFCNSDHVVVDEVVYPPPGEWSWTKIIDVAESLDEQALACLTPMIQGNRPNTYTFTKALAEHVVKCYTEKLPVILFRPSVVISTVEEPVPGWSDSFNGPIGLLAALGKGVLRTLYADPDKGLDYMPVDLVVKAMLVAVWDKASKDQLERPEPVVYNCSSGPSLTMTMRQMFSMGLEMAREEPFEDLLWNPNASPTRHKTVFYFNAIFFHLLPALFADAILTLRGKKRMLFKLQRRIFVVNLAVQYFWHHEWVFVNHHCTELDKRILPPDRKDWSFSIPEIEKKISNYFKIFYIGGKKYLLKDTSSLPKARENLQRMYFLDRVTRFTLILLLTWTVLSSSWIQHAVLALPTAFTFTTLHRVYACCMGFVVLHLVL